MDIAFDRSSWTIDPASSPAEGQPCRPDWHGMIARLSAARGARRALAGHGSTAEAVPAGSFDRGSARVIAEYDASLPGVNRVFWANRKRTRNMEISVAVEINSGDRG